MSYKAFIYCLFIILLSCTTKTNSKGTETKSKIPESKIVQDGYTTYSLNVYKVNPGWAYDILKQHKKIIVQKHIPSVSGNIPFKSKLDADKVGELMLLKIKKGIFPPSISRTELDSLNIKL
jgi:hypothetical protein